MSSRGFDSWKHNGFDKCPAMKCRFALGNARRLPRRIFRSAILKIRKAFSTAVLSHILSHIDAFMVASAMRRIVVPKLFFAGEHRPTVEWNAREGA